MFPNVAPTHRLRPALDWDRREGYLVAFSCDAISELVIVGEAVCERGEAADFGELFLSNGHDCSEGKIDRFEALGLEHLAPEIGINGDGFPLHGKGGWVREEVETVDEADLIFDFRFWIFDWWRLRTGNSARLQLNGTPHPDPLPIGWGEGILRFVKRGNEVGEEIGRDADVGVADDEGVVFGEAFEFDEL